MTKENSSNGFREKKSKLFVAKGILLFQTFFKIAFKYLEYYPLNIGHDNML